MKAPARSILRDARTRDRVAALAPQARPLDEGGTRLPSYIPDSRCQTAPAPPRHVLETRLASEDGWLISRALFVVNIKVLFVVNSDLRADSRGPYQAMKALRHRGSSPQRTGSEFLSI